MGMGRIGGALFPNVSTAISVWKHLRALSRNGSPFQLRLVRDTGRVLHAAIGMLVG